MRTYGGCKARRRNRRIRKSGAEYGMLQATDKMVATGVLHPLEGKNITLGGFCALSFLMKFIEIAARWAGWFIAGVTPEIIDELHEVGVVHLRGGIISRELARYLRGPAPMDVKSKGVTNVDGRAQRRVPGSSIMKDYLIKLLLLCLPAFGIFLDPSDFQYSFKYLTLLVDSYTQRWHQDYFGWRQGLAGVFYLDDGDFSTQFLARSHRPGYTLPTHIDLNADDHRAFTKFPAKAGDIVLFHPNIVHRGMNTGQMRRAVYFSISALVGRVGGFSEKLHVKGTQPCSKALSYNQAAEMVGLRASKESLPGHTEGKCWKK